MRLEQLTFRGHNVFGPITTEFVPLLATRTPSSPDRYAGTMLGYPLSTWRRVASSSRDR